MKRILVLLLLLMIIFGCANSRILYNHPIDNKENPTKIVVYRNFMFMGSALLTQLNVDGILTAEFFGNEFAELPVPPGNHTISTTNAVNVSIANRKVYQSGTTYFFDATYERRKETGILSEVTEEVAKKTIKNMKRIE